VVLDLYGVLVDPEATRRQYRPRLLAHLLAHHGGDSARWSSAYEAAHERYVRKVSFPSFWHDRPYAEAMREAEAGFLEDLFKEAQRPAPTEDLLAYSQRLDTEIFSEIEAAYPESRSVLQELRNLRLEVVVATGAHLAQARAALRGSGLAAQVHGLLTSDHLGARKESPVFWQAAFSSMRRKPWDCVVVDDGPTKLEAAARLGAHAVLVSREGGHPYLPFKPVAVLSGLRTLPDVVRRIGG